MQENKNQGEPIFDLELEVTRLLATPEMQKSLGMPGKKEAWVGYLNDASDKPFDGADENDHIVAEMIFGLLTTYAFLVGHERFADDVDVARYMEIFNKMYNGEDVRVEIDAAAEKLPEAFKDTVSGASQFAQDYLAKRLQAA